MANVTETAEFTEGVYQLEVDDFVEGGENGVDNLPHKNLANRTKYLKEVLDRILSGDTVVSTSLNSEKLNGEDAAFYLPSGTYTAADVLSKLKEVDGLNSGLDAGLLGGNVPSYYLPAGTYTAADVLAKIKSIDGLNSGLDADFLRGVSLSEIETAFDAGYGTSPTSGYMKLSNGFMIAWGHGNAGLLGAGVSNLLPITFPTRLVSLVATHSGFVSANTNIATTWDFGDTNISSFIAYSSNDGEVDISLSYLAIGY